MSRPSLFQGRSPGSGTQGRRPLYRCYAIISSMRSSGVLLRSARTRAGVSQAELAARAGTTQSVISRIESGRSSPSLASLERLISLLGYRLESSIVRSEDGVDRTLLRENLALDAEERVRRGLRLADVVRRNRGAAVGR